MSDDDEPYERQPHGPTHRLIGAIRPTKLDLMIIDCPSAYVVDGDSLRCGNTRLRLLGVDAPELDHCPAWRTCGAGDGHAAKASLSAALRYGPVRYRPVTRDRFGRQVAIVWAGLVNLSCWQLKAGQAVYKPHWDNGRLIARACH